VLPDREQEQRLPNSLPVVGSALAARLIVERALEQPNAWRSYKCWPADGTVPHFTHHYVRALFSVVNAGGQLTVVLVCGRCGHGRVSVPHRMLRDAGITIADVPRLADHRRDYCERCGALGAELHHMAPQALFADADDWPLAYLCQPCHVEWHRVVRDGARLKAS
jgi:hypothetical protein